MTVHNSTNYRLNFLNNPIFGSIDNKCSILDEKLKTLFNKAVPISNISMDDYGNSSRLWSLSDEVFLGIVCHPNGNISLITHDRIINPYGNNKEIITTLKNLKYLPNTRWDLHYDSIKKELNLFPHLKASGIDDQIVYTQVNQIKEVDQNYFTPGITEWIPPQIMETPDKLCHIFRESEGHLSEDNPANRAYILAAVSDPANKVGENKFGREIYFKIMPDGYRAWAHVEKGLITNGGRDTPWKKWIIDSKSSSGRTNGSYPYHYLPRTNPNRSPYRSVQHNYQTKSLEPSSFRNQ